MVRANQQARQVLNQSRQVSEQTQSQLAQISHTAPHQPVSLYSQDLEAFQAAYTAAKARKNRGEPVVPFVTRNATSGLGAREGGRGFGVEIEFELPSVTNQRETLAAIGRDLHAAGIIQNPNQQGYHNREEIIYFYDRDEDEEDEAVPVDYTQWRFERDNSLKSGGEIVSPILYDEPESWEKLDKICEIVKQYGGKATARTGGHVHVGCGDYDHSPANHNRLLQSFKRHEDILYRLAQNPAATRQRGTRYCRPNGNINANYQAVEEVRSNQSDRYVAVNFLSVQGSQSDHVEYRLWDGSLDQGVIQAQINLSLALTRNALIPDTNQIQSNRRVSKPAEPRGTHLKKNFRSGQNRLRGEEWQKDTQSFRDMVDDLFESDQLKEQVTALFAVTNWQL